MIFSTHSSKTFLSALIVVFCSIQFITCPSDNAAAAAAQSNTNEVIKTQTTLTENDKSQITYCSTFLKHCNSLFIQPLMIIRDAISKMTQSLLNKIRTPKTQLVQPQTARPNT